VQEEEEDDDDEEEKEGEDGSDGASPPANDCPTQPINFTWQIVGCRTSEKRG
jgi:hypothetical protein